MILNNSLKIETIQKNNKFINLKVAGKIDTLNSNEFEQKVKGEIADLTKEFEYFRFDFKELEYLCSSGLRVLLWLKKQLEQITQNSKIILENPQKDVCDILDTTGFSDEVVEIEYTKLEDK